MKKVKSLKALVLSLMLCLAMGTTAFASEVSTQGQAAPNANKAVEVSDCGDLDVAMRPHAPGQIHSQLQNHMVHL